MTTVLFARHGEIENPKGVTPFRAVGYPLTAKGREAVKLLGQALSGREIAAIYSSPILRCRQTAEIISKQLQKIVSVDQRLTEVESPFSETREEEFNPGKQSLYQLAEQLKNGEKAEEVVNRMQSFLGEMLEKYADKTVIAVSHGDPIMLLWCSLLGKDVYSLRGNWPEYIPRAGAYEFKFAGKKFSSCGRIA